MNRIDPSTGALWAIIAIAFLVVGAVLTTPDAVLSAEQRGSVIAAAVAILVGIAFTTRKKPHNRDDDEDKE